MTVRLPANVLLLVFDCLVECVWNDTEVGYSRWPYGRFMGHVHDPKDLLRLASVNRLAYEFFMSDNLWKVFDVYNLKSGIAAHCIEHALAGDAMDRMELVETSYPCEAPKSLYKTYNMVKYYLYGNDNGPQGAMNTIVRDKHLFELLQGTDCRHVVQKTLIEVTDLGIFDREFILRVLTKWGELHAVMAECGIIRADDIEAIIAALSSSEDPLCCLFNYGVLTKEHCIKALEHGPASYGVCQMAGLGQDEDIILATISHGAQLVDGLPCENIAEEKLRAAILKGVMNPHCEKIPEAAGNDREIKQIFDYIQGNQQPFEILFLGELVMEGRLELSHAQWDQRIDRVPKWMWDNEQFVLQAVSQFGGALCYAPRYRNHKRIVMTALKYNTALINLVDPRLSCDEEVVDDAIRRNFNCAKNLITRIPKFMATQRALRALTFELEMPASQLNDRFREYFTRISGSFTVQPGRLFQRR